MASARRKRVWASLDAALTGVDGNGAYSNMLSQFENDYGADLVGSTIARTFINFRAIVVTPPIMTGITIGLIKTVESADVTDLLPKSMEARHADWMLNRTYYEAFDPTNGILAGEVDIKAMRKMEELAEAYFVVFQGGGGDVWNVQMHARTLLLLP